MKLRLILGTVILSTQLGCTGSFRSLNSDELAFSSSTQLTEVQEFTKASEVIQAKCLQCHSSGGSAAVAPMDFASSAGFVNSGLVVPGDIDGSKLIARLKGYQPVVADQNFGPKNMPADSDLTSNEVQILKDWVMQLQVANQPQPTEQFVCTDQSDTGVTPAAILTKPQYINALSDLFGSGAVSNATAEIALIPEDARDPLTERRISGITKYHIEAYHRVAKKVSTYITSNNGRTNSVFGSCATGSSPNSSCVGAYLNGTAELIFRRQLTTAEKNRAKEVLNAGSTYRDGLANMLTYHLMAPQFIFVNEVGNQNDNATNFELSQFEIATRIALMTTDSVPDRTLLNAAEAGQLNDMQSLRSQVKRLLSTSRGKVKLKSVIKSWSSMDSTRDTQLLPNSLQQQHGSQNLEAEMISEVDQFLEHIVYSNTGDFSMMLKSKASFASSAELSKIYGHSANTQNPQMGGRRQGLLMRAPALTYDRARTGIIYRGVEFQRNVLCNELPAPPQEAFDMRNDDALTPAQLLNTANRDSVAHQTKEVGCQACHSLINPAGFAFENFGPFGEIRNSEAIFDSNGNFHQNMNIDTRTTVPTFGTKSVQVTDAVDLINHVADEPEGKACFTRQIFRRLKERKETNEDNCQLQAMYATVSNGSLLDAFVELVANPSNIRKKK